MKSKVKEYLLPELQKSKNSWQIHCKAHEDKKASLSVTKKENRYVFHCQAGCTYQEVMDAYKWKKEDLVIKIVKTNEFVYTDEDGQPIFRKNKYDPKDFNIEYYVNGSWKSQRPEDFHPLLYNLAALKSNPDRPVILVEGEKDADRLVGEGMIATTSGGATSFNNGLGEYLKGRRVYIIPDADRPGQEFADKAAEDLLGVAETVSVVNLPGLKQHGDVSDYLDSNNINKLKKLLSNALPYRPARLLPIGQVTDIVARPIKKIALGEIQLGIPTGYDKLDKATGGMQPGSLWVIAARPSVGKTCLALNIIENNPKRKTAFFSLEMNDLQLVQRLVSYHSGLSLTKLSNGQISDDELHKVLGAQEELKKYKFFLDDTPNLSSMKIEERLRAMPEVDLVIIDYLQIMEVFGDNRNIEIGKITGALKNLAKKLNVCIIVLSQLSRNVEYRVPPRPILSDLRDSGCIEQDAAVICFLYRNKTEEGVMLNSADLIIAKNRQGPCYSVPLLFDWTKMYFMPKDRK